MMMSLGSAMQWLREMDYNRTERRVLGGRGQAVLFVTAQGMGSVDQNNLWDRTTNFRQLYPGPRWRGCYIDSIIRGLLRLITNKACYFQTWTC